MPNCVTSGLFVQTETGKTIKTDGFIIVCLLCPILRFCQASDDQILVGGRERRQAKGTDTSGHVRGVDKVSRTQRHFKLELFRGKISKNAPL